MNASVPSNPPVTSSRHLAQAMQQHPLLFYFVLAYAISWILFIPYVLAEWGILQGDFTVMYILHTFGPAMAAVIMTGITGGKAGLQRLRERIRQVRAGWLWYLFMLVGIPALIMLGVLIQPGALESFQGLPTTLLISYPITFVAVFFGGGPLGEEVGWRGFALPRLQARYSTKRFGSLRGTLLLGVLWTCWHLPDFLTASKGGGPGTSLTTFLGNFAVFLVMVTSMAVMFTWIFNGTRGSIFTAIVAHACINTPELTLVPFFPGVDMLGLHRAGLIAFVVLAVLILILTRGRLGYKPGEEQS